MSVRTYKAVFRTQLLSYPSSIHQRPLTRAFAQGAIDYITKPFRSEELIARIKTHLELSELRRAAQIKARQEGTLRELVAGIHRSLDLACILDAAVSNLKWLLGADRVSIVCNRSGQCSVLASTDAAFKGAPCAIDPNPSASAPGKTAIGSLVRCDETDETERAWFARCQVTSEYRLPLFQSARVWGAIVIHRAERALFADDDRLLAPVAAQLSIAIEQSELHDRLQAANAELLRLANLDGLTEIANRRALDKYIEQIWPQLVKDGQSLAAIMLDIDHFKRYNDTYGHLQGDTCLKAIARALHDTLCRDGDFVARYGGEEFCIVLPNTDLCGATDCAQRLRNAVAMLQIEQSSHPANPYVTVSMGLAAMVPDAKTAPRQLVEAADAALYDAKQCGRNCIGKTCELPVASRSLDVEMGLRRSGDDRRLYRDLLTMFLQFHVDFEVHFCVACEENNRDRAFYLVNTLRGGASNIGALLLETAALSLEEALGPETSLDVQNIQVADRGERVVAELMAVFLAIEAFLAEP